MRITDDVLKQLGAIYNQDKNQYDLNVLGIHFIIKPSDYNFYTIDDHHVTHVEEIFAVAYTLGLDDGKKEIRSEIEQTIRSLLPSYQV